MNDKKDNKRSVVDIFLTSMSTVRNFLGGNSAKLNIKKKRISLRTNKEVNVKPEFLGANKTKKLELLSKLKKVHVGVWVLLVIATIAYLRRDDIEHVYLWIKVQSYELMAGGKPTLSTDPIGVFDRTFIRYSEKFKNIPKDQLTPLVFDTITRYKLDAMRYTSTFNFKEGTSYADHGCTLSSEGSLLMATGGMTDDNYILVLTCDGREPKILTGAKLIAFPPEINEMLAPADYYLHYLP